MAESFPFAVVDTGSTDVVPCQPRRARHPRKTVKRPVIVAGNHVQLSAMEFDMLGCSRSTPAGR